VQFLNFPDFQAANLTREMSMYLQALWQTFWARSVTRDALSGLGNLAFATDTDTCSMVHQHVSYTITTQFGTDTYMTDGGMD